MQEEEKRDAVRLASSLKPISRRSRLIRLFLLPLLLFIWIIGFALSNKLK